MSILSLMAKWLGWRAHGDVPTARMVPTILHQKRSAMLRSLYSSIGRIRGARRGRPAPARQQRSSPLVVESLEERSLLSFLPSVQLPLDQSPSQVLVADVTGNGTPDIVMANVNDTVSVILSNGDGTFQAPLTFPDSSGEGITHVAAAHLHGDQAPLDLVVVNSGFAEGGFSVALTCSSATGTAPFSRP